MPRLEASSVSHVIHAAKIGWTLTFGKRISQSYKLHAKLWTIVITLHFVAPLSFITFSFFFLYSPVKDVSDPR